MHPLDPLLGPQAVRLKPSIKTAAFVSTQAVPSVFSISALQPHAPALNPPAKMEKQGGESVLALHLRCHANPPNPVPMNQYPQSPDGVQGQQPPVYQDPNQPQFQQTMAYQQQPGSPQPQQPQGAYIQPQQTGQFHQQAPGMPPQQQSGTVYQNATPIPSLNRSPAPADCPACGQRALTTVAYETGNTTQ